MTNRKHILYLGYSGFPYGYAELQKIMLISKALIHENAKVTILGKRGFHDRDIHPDIKAVGHIDGIKYVYATGNPFRYKNFLKRNLIKLSERYSEYLAIKKINQKEKIDVAIISTAWLSDVIFYKRFSKRIGFKILLNFVEYRSAISKWNEPKYKINDILFDKYAIKISDGILVISEYLISIIKNLSPEKPYLKIPMMVDTMRYDGIKKTVEEKYFLFCGAALYSEIILFNIEAFEQIEYDNVFLYLVINGRKEHIDFIKERILNSPKSKQIKIFMGVSDQELSTLYKNAIGLLIPLRSTIQDIARFPHKIGEYLSSGNPLITTNYGEVQYYLQDMMNALVAESYDVIFYAEKMKYVLTNPVESVDIGMEGKKLAIELADYRGYGKRIIRFIEELNSK